MCYKSLDKLKDYLLNHNTIVNLYVLMKNNPNKKFCTIICEPFSYGKIYILSEFSESFYGI